MSAQIGAQDVALGEVSSQTGEISAGQLAKLGVRYVIVGHSDRRWKLGEDDATINSKIKTVLAEGLVPVVCLGERTRDGDWQGELSTQTLATFGGLTAAQVSACLIAYEPVWAISTTPGAKPDTPASAVRSMSVIRDVLADNFNVTTNTFLYGGSVSPDNAREFLERQEIKGILVGAASLRPDDFAKILSIASSTQ
jgi:triosephosphate isomerase